MTDNCRDVIVDVIFGEEDVVTAPAQTSATLTVTVVITVPLPVAVVIHQHLLTSPLVKEGEFELD